MITENLPTLKIHKLTQKQYEREFKAGKLDEQALYITPDKCFSFSNEAKNILYDNSNSNLNVPNVQEAIDKIGSSYLLLTGGTLSGTLTANETIASVRTGTSSPYLKVENSLHNGGITVSTDGRFGVWDGTHNRFMIYCGTDGLIKFGTTVCEPTLEWRLGTGTTSDTLVRFRRMGSTNNYTVGFYVESGDGATKSYLNLINNDGTRNWALASHTHDYLPLSGGILTGNLTVKAELINVERSNATNACVYVQNSVRKGRLLANSSGYLGVYDDTNSAWLIYGDGSKNTHVGNGSASTCTRLRGNGYAVQIGKGIDNENMTSFIPCTSSGNAYEGIVLGAASSRWYQVYCKSSSLSTSDIRDKNIFELDDRYKNLFMKINTIGFTWKDEDDGVVHIGVGAQPTEQAVLDCGLSNKEFGAIKHDYWKTPNEDGRTDRYSVAYDEIAMLAVPFVQSHEKEIQSLKEEIAELKATINKLNSN